MRYISFRDYEGAINNVVQIIDTEDRKFNVAIPYSTGIQILEQYQTLRDCYVYFYDSKRKIKCGIYNGSTWLCEGNALIPVSGSFIKEASKSETFDMIGIIPCSSAFHFSKMVGIANSVRLISHNSVEVTLNHTSVLVITYRIAADKNNPGWGTSYCSNLIK